MKGRIELSGWAKRQGLPLRSVRAMMTFGTLLAELNPVKIRCHGSVLKVDGARV